MTWLFGTTFLGIFSLPLLAATEPSLAPYAQYGLIGPLVGAIWWGYRREANRADRLEQKLLEAIPALTQATLALNESTEMLRELHRRDP